MDEIRQSPVLEVFEERIVVVREFVEDQKLRIGQAVHLDFDEAPTEIGGQFSGEERGVAPRAIEVVFPDGLDAPQGLLEMLDILNLVDEDGAPSLRLLTGGLDVCDEVFMILDVFKLMKFLVDVDDLLGSSLRPDEIHDLIEQVALSHAALADENLDDVLVDERLDPSEVLRAFYVFFNHD